MRTTWNEIAEKQYKQTSRELNYLELTLKTEFQSGLLAEEDIRKIKDLYNSLCAAHTRAYLKMMNRENKAV